MANFYGRRGARNLNAKVTAQSAAVIRHLWLTKRWTLARLAREFSIGQTTAHKIVHGQTWTDLDVAGEIARLDLLYSYLHGGDVESEGGQPRANVVTHPTLVESEKNHTSASRKGKNHHSIKREETCTLAEAMREIGLDRIEDLTDERLVPLRGQIAKQQMLVKAYLEACPEG